MNAEPFAGYARLSTAERALLEMRPDCLVRAHSLSCDACAAGSQTLGLDLSTIRETVLAALAHGHAITIHPHPIEWNVGVTIHPREGECDCTPEGSGG
jgi:hypothetical protein